jgi:osmotically inducible lipoprotein OsmB
MRRAIVPLAALALLGTVACSNMNETQQRTVSGGAIGAGVGTVGAAITGGCIWCGTLIGGAVGAGSGYIYDQVKKGNM